MAYKFNKDNFHESTLANWKEQDKKEAKKFIDYNNPDFSSPSGSDYFYTDKGVYRLSDHWGINIRSCSWLLDFEERQSKKLLLGFCLFSDFYDSNPIRYLDSNYPYWASLIKTSKKIAEIEKTLIRPLQVEKQVYMLKNLKASKTKQFD